MRKLVLLLSLLPCALLAQPFITNEVADKLFYDDFTDNSENWPSFDEPDIKTYTVEGFYYLSRLNGEKSRAIIPAFRKQENKFMLKTSLMLISTTPNQQTLGILFMAQSDGSGGFVLEINKKQQYRVRGITTIGQYITAGDNGWVKSKNVKGENEFNKIVIKGYNGKYDIYFNDQYTFSFEQGNFRQGEFGLLLGPESKAKVDFFYLYKITASIPDDLATVNDRVDSLRAENDSLKHIINYTLAKKIDSLERVNRKLFENVEYLKEAANKRDTIHLDRFGDPIEEQKPAEIQIVPPVESNTELKEVPVKEADKPKQD
jgi:hypothetical protein